jgi:hypothetical protein
VQDRKERQAVAVGPRYKERTGDTGRGADGGRSLKGRLLAALIVAIAAPPVWLAASANEAQAQRLLQVSGATRTVSATVAIGKSRVSERLCK